MQIINALYSVPQISVLIDQLPQPQYDMLKFYLDFWHKHRDVLLDGELKAYHPEANYSLVTAETTDKLVATAFSSKVLNLDKDYQEIVFVNGTGSQKLLVDKASGLDGYRYTIKSCTGETLVSEPVASKTEVYGFDVPPSGMLVLEKTV